MTDIRCTFMLNPKIKTEVIKRQSKIMEESQSSCSFSHALNVILSEAVGVKIQ